MPLFGFLSMHCQGQLFFAFLFGTGLVCTWHFFSSHQNQNTCPSNGCLTHFLTFLFIHAKQFFFVMFQVKNWLHATPKDVTEPRSSLATTVSRFIPGPLCTFWVVQELNQELLFLASLKLLLLHHAGCNEGKLGYFIWGARNFLATFHVTEIFLQCLVVKMWVPQNSGFELFPLRTLC